MAALPPPSSSSSRRSRTGEKERDRSIGEYNIDGQIGSGSFAVVFRAKHKATGALVAIKSVDLSRLNKKLKDNLYCEIEILKTLQHPHIVALIDCRESKTGIHLIMEYCLLGDLSFLIKKRDKLADNEAMVDMVRRYPPPGTGGLNEVVVRHFLQQLASAMKFLWERNFIHRDIKPQNLLILPSPHYMATAKEMPLIQSATEDSMIPAAGLASLPILKLADFGFARSLPKTSLAETLCGSPLYMAPEILRYEKYDAKADLWSMGTVVFEMITGKPPFRATNHVELLRKIEMSEDHIKFPKEAVMSSALKDVIRCLLKKAPVERMDFEELWKHPVMTEPIPNLIGVDRPREKEPRIASRSTDQPVTRTPSTRSDRRVKTDAIYSSPRERPMPPSPRTQAINPVRQLSGTPPRAVAQQARPSSWDQKRPRIPTSATAPNAEAIQAGRPPSRPTVNRVSSDQRTARSRNTSLDEGAKEQMSSEDVGKREAMEEAEQAVRDAREYVLVEKRAVEVNAFADELAANPRLQGARNLPSSRAGAISGAMTRRATTQGVPTSGTGAVPASPSRAVQIAQGRPRPEMVPQRQGSVGRSYGSPSATSAIAKALNNASVKVFGVSWSPSLIGKGASPPQLYNPFPAYPTPHGTIGLIGDGRPSGPVDEDQKAVNIIEESATRSDVVYGFAEVKYRQLIPLAPSMDHGLGGPAADTTGVPAPEDEGLTVEAIVALSEEALVLYVKSLALLAKSMDVASTWWSKKERAAAAHPQRQEPISTTQAGHRINSAVQWVRNRFNEVLEKAEFVRQKLADAQRRLPQDNPAHPSNHATSSRLAGASSTEDVYLTPGVTAEKLMYDRALEMSRSAAINEIANEDLPGCEISYVTAIRMLEAVLDSDEEQPPQRRRSSSLREKERQDDAGAINGINVEDRQDVQKVVAMVRTRLSTLRRKIAIIVKHQSLPPSSPRPASITHSGGTTPTVANTPPH